MIWIYISVGLAGMIIGATAIIVAACVVCGAEKRDHRVVCQTELRWLPPRECDN